MDKVLGKLREAVAIKNKHCMVDQYCGQGGTCPLEAIVFDNGDYGVQDVCDILDALELKILK